ncbi:MAG: transaldolase [Burkholderiales bacterium]|nr:transaldolase [Burkholderiales bacterium]
MAQSVNTESRNPFRELAAHGQSVWLDYIRRDLTASGELARLVEEGLAGLTSNPAIFERAIAGSDEYADLLVPLSRQGLEPEAIYERIAIRDIRDAADALAPRYASSGARDGYVSLEVSPRLARDAQGTIAEARRLWRAVDRPNLMIKVPGTPEGLPAIRALLADGINVNVTLIFSCETYAKIVETHAEALEDRIARGEDVRSVASVASFFVSRIDAAVDALIGKRAASSARLAEQPALAALLGRTAVASARLAYRHYLAHVCTERWQALAARGAQPQRLLWASTSTKNPDYRDVMYVEELIGPYTVNTVPPATLAAFRDHGRARASLTEQPAAAADTMAALAELGISIQTVTDGLLEEGVRLFVQAFDQLLAAIAEKARRAA